MMEPLIEVSVAEDSSEALKAYLYKVEGGACYSTHHSPQIDSLKVTEVIFLAERDLRVRG